MELTIDIDDSDVAPGRYLTGTLTLYLTAHYPLPAQPSPIHSTTDDDEPDLLYQPQLAQQYSQLLHASAASPPQLQVTEVLDRLQLQVLGKCLPDVGKLPKDVVRAARPAQAADSHSWTVLSTAAVTLERFDRPMAFDLLHQPYTCQRTADSRTRRRGRIAAVSNSHVDSSVSVLRLLSGCVLRRRVERPAAGLSPALLPRRITQDRSAVIRSPAEPVV